MKASQEGVIAVSQSLGQTFFVVILLTSIFHERGDISLAILKKMAAKVMNLYFTDGFERLPLAIWYGVAINYLQGFHSQTCDSSTNYFKSSY